MTDSAEQIERALPAGPDRIFRLVEPVLTQTFGQGTYRLGGGTALAAVWDHRHSTDIDLFADHAAYRAGVNSEDKKQRLKEALSGILEPLGPQRIEVQRGFIKTVCRHVEFGLYTPPSPLDTHDRATDRVAGTAVALERPAVILARKIHGRMLGNGVLTLRDLYDIAAASVLAPEELQAVLLTVADEDKESLRKELRLLPRNWSGNPEKSGRALIDARRPAALAEAPHRSIAVVRSLLAGDWSWADRIRARQEAEAAPAPGG